MYDYSNEINEFYEEKVRLSVAFKDKLYAHRNANRDRLISRLKEMIEGLSINSSSFRPQGSMAMRTIIQTKFDEAEYDIDDGLVLKREELINSEGNELTISEVREYVKEALKDSRFIRGPKLHTNCVRVYYKERDPEKHHVDFAIYRKYDEEGKEIRELANQENWVESDPTQINCWFEDIITERNVFEDGKGSRLRVLIQLLKRFARSRQAWDLPNGLKLTMLVTECQENYSDRIDEDFRNLLIKIEERLIKSKLIYNLAHPEIPPLTRTSSDANVENLLEKVTLALEKLEKLDDDDCDAKAAQMVWDWIFQSDGFLEDITDEGRKSKSFANRTPNQAVDHQGGGRFGSDL